jgi:hypothetical protein
LDGHETHIYDNKGMWNTYSHFFVNAKNKQPDIHHNIQDDGKNKSHHDDERTDPGI